MPAKKNPEEVKVKYEGTSNSITISSVRFKRGETKSVSSQLATVLLSYEGFIKVEGDKSDGSKTSGDKA